MTLEKARTYLLEHNDACGNERCVGYEARDMIMELAGECERITATWRWISVDERLPDVGQRVWSWRYDPIGDLYSDHWEDGEHMDVYYPTSMHWIKAYCVARGIPYYVTHWMPLPQPPAVQP